MPGRSEAVYKRALMRDLMRRINRLSAECGVNADDAAGDGSDADDFSVLARRIQFQVEAIQKDARAKTRVADSASATEGVTLSHEIRRKRATLSEDLDKLKAMTQALHDELERKRDKAKNKPRRLAEVGRLEAVHGQREAMQADLLDTVAKLDMLIGKVLQVASEKDERRMAAATQRPSGHRKLNLMGSTMNKDGTFERPASAPQDEMDAETAALFQAIDAKQQKINVEVDAISKQVKNLKSQAKAMGEELTAQNLMLDTVEHKMDHLEGELSTLTLRLGKFSKQVKGGNVCLGACCLLLLIALTGYIIYMVFPGIVPT